MKLRPVLLAIPLLLAGQLCAQTASDFDSSGNSFLSGTYSFRQTYFEPDYSSNAYGTLNRSVSLYGTISFDGNGNYTIAGSELDSSATVTTPQAVSLTGTYAISASGFGFLLNPVDGTSQIYGSVAQGIFIGSSTESNFNDLFIAAQSGSPAASTATLNGTYYVTEVDFPTSDPGLGRDAFYPLTADGAGNVASLTFSGYVANNTSLVNQPASGVTYALSGGVGTLNFPADTLSSTVLVQGPKTFYATADGTFFFGGAANGYDMLIGVIGNSGSVDNTYFNGLYYQAGLDLDSSNIASQATTLDTYYGAVNAFNGTFLAHQRLNFLVNSNAYDYTYDDTYSLNSAGGYQSTDGFQDLVVGDGGLIRIGSGIAPLIGLNVSIAAPTFTGTGVFLDPTGFVNSASSAPFTADVAPGEFLTLYGTGLAPSVLSNTSLPISTTLNGVQVLVDGVPAPVFYVSPTQVNIGIPYGIPLSTASFQVVNNGSSSNTVTQFVNNTAAGVFTTGGNGIGPGAVQHASDYSVVTDSNPASVGETLITYAAGLGVLQTSVADGAASSGALVSNDIAVFVGGQQATTTFVGLSGFANLYQINFVVPALSPTGDYYLDVSGPDSYNSQATLSVTSAAADSVRKSKTAHPRRLPAVAVHRTAHNRIDRRIPVAEK